MGRLVAARSVAGYRLDHALIRLLQQSRGSKRHQSQRFLSTGPMYKVENIGWDSSRIDWHRNILGGPSCYSRSGDHHSRVHLSLHCQISAYSCRSATPTPTTTSTIFRILLPFLLAFLLRFSSCPSLYIGCLIVRLFKNH